MELVHPRYVAEEVLGRGGEGVVVRVRDREAPTRALVAKVLARGVDEARLEGEFALLARLRVPGLVRAHDLARDGKSGTPFLVEDFVDGPDAIAFVATGDRVRRLATLLLSVARTLDGLHSAGFVHGDLKPAHVRVDRAVQLLDLGAAVAPGFTRAYAAPEVIAGAPSSVASDLYGLGATIFAAATGAPPNGSPLRTIAPWVPPSVADLVDRLLRTHPRDRFASARDVVAALAGNVAGEETAGTTLIGREREIDLLSRAIAVPGAVYVVGPSGAGKSHLAREVAMRALLSGREVRQVSATEPHPRLIAFLRGGAWPFEGASHRALLVVDDLDRGAPELAGAIEAFRCLSSREGPTVIATAPRAPDGAPSIEVGPLGITELAALCRAIEVPEREIAEAARTSEGLPGWLLAARGRIPLTRAAAVARMEGASEDARALLAVVSLFGGRALAATCRAIVPRAVENELFARALLERGPSHQAPSFRLSSPSLARELAETFATPSLVARVSAAALREETPAATLLALASVSESRVALLGAAADRARASEERAIEIRALTTLGEGCEPTRLRRLE
ncbi:MAG: protein kinase domain-containing protein, partial [Polyangiales bacterium]